MRRLRTDRGVNTSLSSTTSTPLLCVGNAEPQHRHNLLFHKSRHDPLAYYKTCLEDSSETIERYREMVCVAEVDARHSKTALAGTQTQVGSSKFRPWISESIDAADGAWSRAYLGHKA